MNAQVLPEERGPVFIGGPHRCGKTTLQAFLSSHPNICIPVVGSNFWTYFYGQYGDLSRPENFRRCLSAMLRYKHAIFMDPDAERIRREFWMGEPSYARLFALFHEHFAERQGKPRWGDQTGLVERYADQIFAGYPGAKMIHMLRDPRDRYEASLAMWPNGKARVGGATARWLYSVRWACRNSRLYPERYMIVRYESLVCQTDQTLREICAFIGEEFQPVMLSMDGSPGHREKLRQGASQSASPTSLSPNFIGRYRGAICNTEIAFMQNYAGRLMKNYDYELESLEFSSIEKLRYTCSDLPLNWLRMQAWLAQEMVQHHFPSIWGRKPSQHMVIAEEEPRKNRVTPAL